MPWSNQSGGGGGPWGQKRPGGGGGPWGGGPQGGGGGGPGGPGGPGGAPPDLEDLLRRSQDRLRQFIPGGSFGGGKGIAAIAVGALLLWGATGFYTVRPDEVGLNMIFGRYVGTTQPGLNYNFPFPIGAVIKPRVTVVNSTEVGYRGSDGARRAVTRDVLEESLMLTGDENIVDIDFVVQWQINPARAAETYASKVVPEARGEAARIQQEAEAYRERLIAEAAGQASRFSQVFEEYRKAPEITRERLYLETMERVLGATDKIILDQRTEGGQGVVPFLPLSELQRRPAQGTLPGQGQGQGAIR
jgi:regulator of protease activity HflC (stomatin/prohibitin superfamily)